MNHQFAVMISLMIDKFSHNGNTNVHYIRLIFCLTEYYLMWHRKCLGRYLNLVFITNNWSMEREVTV
jgi:hypothetical protein